ncbi:DUF6884 domain-containing protein [Cupriavidus plantarum]
MLLCSALKAATPAPAMELYRGFLYQTFAAHVRGGAAPAVVILSALHGFIKSSATISPYEQRMDKRRADHFIERLNQCTQGIHWPPVASGVFLAGRHNYRFVMRAAVAAIAAQLPVIEVSGGIGMQRSQLGKFLRGLEPALGRPHSVRWSASRFSLCDTGARLLEVPDTASIGILAGMLAVCGPIASGVSTRGDVGSGCRVAQYDCSNNRVGERGRSARLTGCCRCGYRRYQHACPDRPQRRVECLHLALLASVLRISIPLLL